MGPSVLASTACGGPYEQVLRKAAQRVITADATGDRRAGELAGAGLVALERPPGREWAAWRDIDVHAHQRGTDISPLACTAGNTVGLSAVWKSRSASWH